MPGDLDERIDSLYGLGLEDFVPARDALAKELRKEKRREEAGEVAKLKRPSAAAWAVNQVVRTQGAAIRELWEAGDELAAAQSAAAAGTGDRDRLRAAMTRQRAALGPAAEAVRGLLTGRGRGLGEAIVQAAIDTLNAASLDAGAREGIAEGRATEAAGPVGLFGFGGAAEPAAEKPAATTRAKAKPEAEATTKAKAKPEAEPEAEAEGKAEPEAKAKGKAKGKAEAKAKRDEKGKGAEKAERKAAKRAAAEARERHRERIAEAREALARARSERDQAAARADEARRALRAAQDADDEAQAALDQARDAEAEAREALDALRAEEPPAG